jgi:CubicO group peptidase (beta-lactamase class C family)
MSTLRMIRYARICSTATLAFLAMVSRVYAAEEPLLRAKPEEVGVSSERLAMLGTVLKQDIDSGRIPGAVIAIARRGKLVMLEAYGWQDKEAKLPMTAGAIFNIASMTKPMTAAGLLMLYEQGRVLMDDPLAQYLPGFGSMRVAARDGNGEPVAETVPAQRKVTIQDLLRHTSGIIYGGRGTTLVHKLYPEGSVAASQMTATEFITKLSSLPLLHQPGTVWDYGFGLDLAGLTIEAVTKQTLGAYLTNNLWHPLGMTDTQFHIEAGKAPRYAKPLPADPVTGKQQAAAPDLTRPIGFDCGGGCASSTAADYLRFALMLMNKGRLGDKQILARKTVEYMLSDQLGSNVKNLIGNADPTRADFGFGLGLAVRTTAGAVRLMGSPGMFTWPGASGTDWWADPKEELAVVYLSAAPGPIRWHYRQKINALVYQAIAD